MATPGAQFLLDQIDASKQRHRKYLQEGRRITGIYEEDAPDQIPFNILYSNTETLAPALYNSVPRPLVLRRYKDKDPFAAAACQLGKRTLEYELDNGYEDYPTFDDVLKDAVLAALVPGRGIVRAEYRATFEKDPETGKNTKVATELVCAKTWPWDRFFFGFADKWKNVPWIAYAHDMTKDELEKNFGKAVADAVCKGDANREDEQTDREMEGEDKLSDAEKASRVYEVWHKESRQIYWVAEGYKEGLLEDPTPDPYQLTGFYDCAEPLRLFRRIKTMIPRPLYRFYENQAKELNSLTLRIQGIVKQIKVRGAYDSTLGDTFEKIFKEDEDGAYVPVANPALSDAGSLQEGIWSVPVDKLAQTYVQLVQQREQVKRTIYEITGISDILRGSSVASETATAQEIKNQWGTLRLKRMQKLVGIFARSILRIMLELSMAKLSAETLKAMTGLQLPLEAEKQQAQMVVEQFQAMQQQMPAPMGAPGQPPQPPQVPPEVQKAQVILNSPSIEQLQQMLNDDKQRNYRIDIETNSTIDAEATEDKQDIAELLNAVSQFLNGIGPLIQSKVMPFEVAKAMLLTVVRRYNFGPEMEAQLEAMQEPQQQNDPKAMEQQQAEMQKVQQQLQQEKEKLMQERMELEMQKKEIELQKQMAVKEIQMHQKFSTQQLVMDRKLQEEQLNTAAEKAINKIMAAREAEKESGETE